jgi:periplasmic copper chaperone A
LAHAYEKENFVKKAIWMTTVALLLGLSAALVSAANDSGEAGALSARAARMPKVNDAWARATVPGQQVGAAYMKIYSSADVALLKAETIVAKSVEVHSMDHQNGVMRMRALGPLQIGAGTTVELAPGRTHFMLLGLKKPLKAGETLRLKLTFASADMVETVVFVDVPIRPLGQ